MSTFPWPPNPTPAAEAPAPLRTVLLPTLLLLALLAALLWRFAYTEPLFLSFFTDDFFYYAGVARNLACCGLSTFNGLQPTNGYHPLWLLAIAALYKLFGDTRNFFIAVTLLLWLLVAASWPHLRRAQDALTAADASPFALPLALFSLTYMAVLSRTGMEVSAGLFFLFVFYRRMAACPLEDQTPAAAIDSGLLASCLILSRLDTALIVLVYGLLGLFAPSGSRAAYLRRSLLFLAGLTPVFLYVALNRLEFHTLLPISGMAKNLKPFGGAPSSSTLARLLQPDLINLLFTWPSLLLMLLYLARFSARRRLSPRRILWSSQASPRVALCVLLHPILFYATLSFTSDWPLWTWYLYPLVPVAALLGPLALAPRSIQPKIAEPPLWSPRIGSSDHSELPTRAFPAEAFPAQSTRQPSTALDLLVALLCLGVIVSLGRLNPDAVSVLTAARNLHAFAQTHPGRYAMGDRAGTAAWLMASPVLQLEGLMADKPFLERIAQRENLLEALHALGADYYITYTLVDNPPPGPCLLAREPYKAGPLSPALEARLCAPPVASFVNDGIDTLVFNLHDPGLAF